MSASPDLVRLAALEECLRPPTDPETGIDLSLIEENLKLTPWERLLANDDAVNFVDEARNALRRTHATASRSPAPLRLTAR